jgi:hypothetical protein
MLYALRTKRYHLLLKDKTGKQREKEHAIELHTYSHTYPIRKTSLRAATTHIEPPWVHVGRYVPRQYSISVRRNGGEPLTESTTTALSRELA